MMNEHLTEQEIQRYALNAEECGGGITTHVEACAECSTRVKEYLVIFRGLEEQPPPSFDFDLATAVMERVENVKRVKKYQWGSYAVIFVCVVVIVAAIFVFRDKLMILYSGVASFVLYLVITGAISLLAVLCLDMYKNFQKKTHSLDMY